MMHISSAAKVGSAYILIRPRIPCSNSLDSSVNGARQDASSPLPRPASSIVADLE